MSRVHVYPVMKRRGKRSQTSHVVGKTADCWCEPKIKDEGVDDAGDPALVYVHSAKQDWRRKRV